MAEDRWLVLESAERMSVNVLPIEDVVRHDEDDGCICGPDVQYVDVDGTAFRVPMITHHSLDGRELIESDSHG